jgi:FtsP/CotA-like multicopper oxidase with cupredoxin domain
MRRRRVRELYLRPRRLTPVRLASSPRSLLVVAAIAFVGCRSSSPAPSELVREFAGAYPESRAANGTVRQLDLVAKEVELPLIDGTKLRVWAYNGQVPGPTLRVRLGETVRVRFRNELPQATTVHWHGVRVPNNMDGVPFASQPPVEPGGSFIYEFTPKDAGTFWFHPHMRSSEQVERGLYGVLVVEDESPAAYTADVVWVLDDWLLDEKRRLVEQFNTRHDLAHDGRWGNVITVNARTDTSLALKSGERIRLRLLNASNGRVYAPDFTGVDATIIAVDGMYLRAPIALERFEIAPGNRVDLDITVRGGESRVVPVVDRFFAQRPNRLATLVVDGIHPHTPSFASPARAHVPSWREALTAPVAKEFRLNARQGGEFGIQWTINGEAFAGHQHHARSAATLRRGSFVRLRFTNESYRLHPMHIHGMFFKVVARNNVPVDEPFFRDTVLIHAQETVDIGLVPLDAGSWMMHCHILEHQESGMMTMIDVSGG